MIEKDKYYQILGLKSGATEKEIVEAYKVLLKVWNPDRFSNDPNIQKIAADKIKEIDEAFKQLLIGIGSHPEKGKVIQESQSGLRTEPPGTGGSVVIQTEPLEAKIYFNGKLVGTSPCKGKQLRVGSYRVRVIKDGYEIWEQNIDIYAGEEKEVFAKLKLIEPESGQLWKDPYTEMEFVYVKGGHFEMGDTFGDGMSDEQPVHKVFLDDFYIGRYQVTQDQWKKVMGNNPSYYSGERNDYPVESVSWENIQEYIRRLKEITDKSYRLPTEAEWEYAARSGGKKENWAGTSSRSELGEYAWYDKNYHKMTQPVGKKRGNGLGLYDMSGNVWEWCGDWYDNGYYRNSPVERPTGPYSGKYRVVRGGAEVLFPGYIRAASRYFFNPAHGSHFGGFRLVLPTQPEQLIKTENKQPKTSEIKVNGIPTPSRGNHHRFAVKEPESKASPFISIDDSELDHANLNPRSYVSLPPTVLKGQDSIDSQTEQPPQGGLGVGTKVGLTVMVILIGGIIRQLVRDFVGTGIIPGGLVLGAITYTIWRIWSRPSKKANK